MMSSVMSSALTVCVCILLPSATGSLFDSRLCMLSGVLQGAEPASLQENVTVRCGRGSRCYGLWEKTVDGELHLLSQGCWTHVGNLQECVRERCILHTHTRTHTHTSLINTHYHFCCCDQDLCNANYTMESPAPQPIKSSNGEASATVHQLTSEEAVLVALVTVAIAAILIVALFLGYRLMKRRKRVSSEDRMEASDGEPITDLSELQLEKMIGRGRYGAVFRGVLNERYVAVKLFNSENRQTFFRERSLYGRLPPHHNLARLLRADQRTGADGQPEFIIVMEFYPNGCLSQYLSVHSVDWWTMCRMTHGVTLGLSFLHTELHTPGESKVGVAHRDVSSRNVLVRSDLSCVLSDFNLSISLKDTPCYHGDQHTLPIAEVGSVRYLSPEVLGGSVNLREWGGALKQADVYALGLMFWESFRRCSDLFTGEPPEYQLAFQAELGDHPTLDQMKTLVLREKFRPRIPENWKEHTQLCSLVELIEDCWDQDAEARLSAQCVEERLSDLTLMSGYNSEWPQLGVVENLHGDSASVVMTTTNDMDVPDKNRKCVNHHRQQRPVPSEDTSEHPQVPESLPHLHRKDQLSEVQMGVAKMDTVTNVVTAEPHPVTMVTNLRQKEIQCSSGVCEAEDGGKTNPAGPQENQDQYGEHGALNVLHFSPDEHQPLLSREEPPQNPHLHHHHHHHHHHHSNSNNNNNQSRRSAEEEDGEELASGSDSEGPQVFNPPEPAAGLEGSDPAGPQSPGPEPQSADLPPRGRTNPRRADRPRSLDLSSPGLALDVPLSASAEKIKRRVKTPYMMKKWRPASWVVSTDQYLDFNLHQAGTFRMNQSMSSMAVFLVGGGATETTTSDPDGITSF